jgi:ketosteroid isomerase-like protein
VTPEIATVRAWHEAVNAGDVERAVELCRDDVEVGGPRGVAHGRQVVREWFARAGIRLEPARVFQRGEAVVAEQRAEWRRDRGAEPGDDDVHAIASAFVVRDGLIARVTRHDDLAVALAAAGMDETDEQPAR